MSTSRSSSSTRARGGWLALLATGLVAFGTSSTDAWAAPPKHSAIKTARKTIRQAREVCYRHLTNSLPADHEDPKPESYPPLPDFKPLAPGEIAIYSKARGPRIRARLYHRGGGMNQKVAKRIEAVFRDKRNRRRHIHRRIMTMLYLVAQHYNRPIEVISGYRPARRKSRSRHARGQAVDFRVPGVPPIELAHFLKGRFERVGIGYYPTSKFVHLDVRDTSYYWWDPSGPGQRGRSRKLEVDRRPRWGSDWTVKKRRLPKSLRWKRKPKRGKKR